MNRRTAVWYLATVFLTMTSLGWAQQSGKIYRVGYLNNTDSMRPLESAFRKRLQELGYTEGQNLIIEWRLTKGDRSRVPSLVADLINLKVDSIVSGGVGLTRALREATATIPIVMMNADDDPVRTGLVASLARPGGNVTGFTNIGSELAGKRLELLKETVPKSTRVAILFMKDTAADGHVRETETVAPALGIRLQLLALKDGTGIEGAFKNAVTQRANGLIVVHVGGVVNYLPQIVSLAAKAKLPAIYSDSQGVISGGLMSYSDDAPDRARRVAEYVDRILKGTQPADLPVQRPIKFELIINLNAAKQIGLTVPPNFLARADKVIK